MPPDGSCLFVSGRTRKQEAALMICCGDFGIAQTPRLAVSLDSLLTGAVRLVVLDFSKTRVFSANAAAVLANFMAGVRGRGRECVIFKPSHVVRTMLQALDLDHLFTIQETEEELLLDLPDEPLV
jgi:anti-anti-sigma factor